MPNRPTPPSLIVAPCGFIDNFEEIDRWARCNCELWRNVSISLHGRSEGERLRLIAAVLLIENEKLTRFAESLTRTIDQVSSGRVHSDSSTE